MRYGLRVLVAFAASVMSSTGPVAAWGAVQDTSRQSDSISIHRDAQGQCSLSIFTRGGSYIELKPRRRGGMVEVAWAHPTHAFGVIGRPATILLKFGASGRWQPHAGTRSSSGVGHWSLDFSSDPSLLNHIAGARSVTLSTSDAHEIPLDIFRPVNPQLTISELRACMASTAPTPLDLARRNLPPPAQPDDRPLGRFQDRDAESRMINSGALRWMCRDNRHYVLVEGHQFRVNEDPRFDDRDLCTDDFEKPQLKGIATLPSGERLLLVHTSGMGFVIRTSPNRQPEMIKLDDAQFFGEVLSSDRIKVHGMGVIPMPGTNCMQVGDTSILMLDWESRMVALYVVEPEISCEPATRRSRRN